MCHHGNGIMGQDRNCELRVYRFVREDLKTGDYGIPLARMENHRENIKQK